MPNNYVFDLNSALKAGYTPDQVAQYLDAQQKKGASYQLTDTPQATPQQSQVPVQPKSNFIADALPTVGSIVGGIGGALLPGLGETGVGEIGGAAAGSAAGEALKETIEGQPLSASNIASQGVVGGVGGAVGKGVGYVGGKVLSKVAQSIGSNVSDVAAQSINKATPAAWEKVANQHGVDLNQLTKDYVAPGSSYNDLLGPISDRGNGGALQDQLKTAEDQIQSTVKTAGSNIRIAPTTLIPQLQQEAKTLSMLPGNENKIDSMNNIITQFQKQYPNGLSAQRALAIKRTADSKFGQAVVNDENGTAASMAQKMIANAARSTLKQMFPELSDALDTQSNILTLQPILSKARASTNTQGSNFLNAISQVDLTKPGTYIAAPVKNVLSNPQVASRFLNPTIPQVNPLAGNVAAQTVGQGITRTLLPATPDGDNSGNSNGDTNANQTNSQISANQNNTFPSSPSQASGNSTISGANSQALPATPGEAFGTTGTTSSTTLPASPNAAFQSQPPADFMKGYTVNGAPVDPATANMIWQIVNYRVDPNKITSLKNNERQQLVSLASQYDPSYTSSQYPVVEATRKDFTSGKSSQTIRSLNTAIGHLNVLAQAGAGLGNGQFPIINSAKNEISQGTGQPAVGKFNTAANAVGGEMAQVFKNSGATDDEINAWKSQINPNMSPAQLQASINQMISLMGSRLSALQSQYASNVGKPADFSFISPESAQILQGLGIDPSTLEQSDTNALPANP